MNKDDLLEEKTDVIDAGVTSSSDNFVAVRSNAASRLGANADNRRSNRGSK